MMTANTPGSCHTKQVGQETVHSAKVGISTECKRTEDMPGGVVEDRTDVAVEFNKNDRKMNRGNGETAKRTLC